MRPRNRFIPILLIPILLCGALTLGCGGSDGDAINSNQIRIGPMVFALPFLPIGGTQGFAVGLKNNAGVAATVYVTPYLSTGIAYAGGTSPVVIPPNGEVRTPIGLFLGELPDGGWVCVDTRDTTTLDPVTGEPTPVATSGFVIPYLHRTNTGGILGLEEVASQGITGRSDSVVIPITTQADAVQLVNYSFTPMAGGVVPAAVTFDVETLDAFGVATGAPIPVPVGAYGSVFAPIALGFDEVGSLRITPTAPVPAGVEIHFMASAQEIGVHDAIPSRYNETSVMHWPGQLDVAFDLDFGPDVAGSIHDFGVVMNNPTDITRTVVLRQIFTLGGAPMLPAPLTYNLRPHGTVFMRTTTTDSRGLDILAGERSFFNDIFGDAFLAADHEEVSLWMQVPREVNISARHFDRSFGSFYRVLKAIQITNNVCVSDVPIQQSLLTQWRNEVRITNPNPNELSVPIRGFTPGGTEYILDPIMVPANGYVSWTPDGTIYREDPSDPIGVPVNFMHFLFTPPGGAFFRGRATFRQTLPPLVIFVTPQNTRAN